MLHLWTKSNYFNEIVHDFNQLRIQRKFLDCQLVFSDGCIPCHAAMLQHCKQLWWTNCRTIDMDEFYVILPDMTISDGWKLIKNVYCEVDSETFADCNNNSHDDEGSRIVPLPDDKVLGQRAAIETKTKGGLLIPEKPQDHDEGSRNVPLSDKVLDQRAAIETKTKGGLLIPEKAQAKQNEGIVVSVGPRDRIEAGVNMSEVSTAANMDHSYCLQTLFDQ